MYSYTHNLPICTSRNHIISSKQASNKQASGSGGQQASKHVFNADLGKKASRNLLVSKADVNYDRLLASPHPPHTYTPRSAPLPARPRANHPFPSQLETMSESMIWSTVGICDCFVPSRHHLPNCPVTHLLHTTLAPHHHPPKASPAISPLLILLVPSAPEATT